MQVIKIFCIIDDFCKEFDTQIKTLKQPVLTAGQKPRNKKLQMSTSEKLTIMICFHLGVHKTFKHYYQQVVQQSWSDLFPATLSYNRFIEVKQRYFVVLSLFLKDKILLRKRAIIETINDELKNHCRIEHSRHRSISNFIMNILAALTAYCFFPKKPALNIDKVYDGQLFLKCA